MLFLSISVFLGVMIYTCFFEGSVASTTPYEKRKIKEFNENNKYIKIENKPLDPELLSAIKLAMKKD